MAAIDLSTVKQYLRVTHSLDDALLRRLLESAEDEARKFLNREELPTLPHDYPTPPDSPSDFPYSDSEEVPSSEDPVAPSVVEGVCLLVKAGYDTTTAAEREGYRKAAETVLAPYRVGWGV